jgi:hypothetical protein
MTSEQKAALSPKRNIVAEQVAQAILAAEEIEGMAKQIIDPPHWRKRLEAMAKGVRFVVENFRLMEELYADEHPADDDEPVTVGVCLDLETNVCSAHGNNCIVVWLRDENRIIRRDTLHIPRGFTIRQLRSLLSALNPESE